MTTPPRDNAGTGADVCEHSPTGLLQNCPGGQDASAQQVSSTQLPDKHSVASVHAPPFGARVWVGVTVAVRVAVAVAVAVGVAVSV